MPHNIQGPEVSIVDLIDAGMMEDQTRKNEDRVNGIKYFPLRPSAAGQCSRKLALELEEYRGIRFHNKPTIEPNIMRLFTLGHSVERAVIDAVTKFSGFEASYRQQVVDICTLDTGELIEGSIDLVLIGGEHKMIADVKSKKDKFSSSFKSGWDELIDSLSKFPSCEKISSTGFYADNLEDLLKDLDGDFMSDNFLQLNLYANTKFCKDRRINIATVIYYQKNDSRMFELRFKPSEKVAKQIHDKFNRVSNAVKAGKVENMECDFLIGTLRHSFCDCHKMSPYLPDDPSTYFFNNLPKKTWPKDVAKMKGAKELEECYEKIVAGLLIEREIKQAEEEILSAMLKQKVQKIRFSNGDICEAKFLKSPREHYELRRAKL